ncbi:MAG: peptidase M20 [Rhodospirillaceae bacterium]|jgi:acetylornithine deacetylase/succinyl-diaminopimelate desuccinylase-like protein|nr:peptidase M20 [Rhodospirillaceae bacterium]
MDESLKSRIHDYLVAGRAGQFQFLKELVRTPSQIPPGDAAAVAELTARTLKSLGFGVERHPVPKELVRERGLSAITNLVVRHQFASGPVVALNAHGDTGPAGDGWTADPLGGEIKDGVLYGLGALTKADLVVYTHALAALRDTRPDLSGTVELHFTFDGEGDGQLGPGWLLGEGIVNPDYAVGSGYAYGIGTSAMGDLQLRVEIETMAAQEPPADAMETTARVLNALYGVRENLSQIRSEIPGIGSPELVIGEIEGGTRPDAAPSRVVFALDRRLIPDEDPAAVETGLTNLIAATASASKGIVCRIGRLGLSAPMKPEPGTDKLAQALERQATEVMDRPIRVCGVPYDTNSRHYAAWGIPTVLYGAGPATRNDGHAGAADERLMLDDLRKATEVAARGLAEFLAPAG